MINPPPSLSPCPGDRARYWLAGEWDQPDSVVAKLADASRTTVQRARSQLEDLGTIPVRDPGLSDDAWTTEPPEDVSRRDDSPQALTAAQRARMELEADPQASNSRIAERARCSRDTVLQVRRYLEDTGLIVTILAGDRDAWTPSTGRPPPPGELRRGSCVGHPRADIWTSENKRDRAEAKSICASCPVREPCLDWSLSLGVHDDTLAIYGGLGIKARIAAKRERQRYLPGAPQADPRTRCGTCGRALSGGNLVIVASAGRPDYRGCAWCRRRDTRESARRRRGKQRSQAAGPSP